MQLKQATKHEVPSKRYDSTLQVRHFAEIKPAAVGKDCGKSMCSRATEINIAFTTPAAGGQVATCDGRLPSL